MFKYMYIYVCVCVRESYYEAYVLVKYSSCLNGITVHNTRFKTFDVNLLRVY